MSEYHEPVNELDAFVRDRHRALRSLQEEIEAVDWYDQRLACATDPELSRVLEHNRNEEMEHASMLLEWLRRRVPEWEPRLSQFLWTARELGPEAEKAASGDPPGDPSATNPQGRGLGVGSLKEAR